MWKEMKPPLVTSLVTTASVAGEFNASPKSWWTPVNYEPPMLMLSTKTGSDSDVNIDKTRQFILHLPPQSAAQKVLHTAKPLPYGENELDDVQIPYEVYTGRDELKIPVVNEWPWMYCTVVVPICVPRDADHSIWLAEVKDWGGYDGEVTEALLHKGRNTFVEVGQLYDVEPY